PLLSPPSSSLFPYTTLFRSIFHLFLVFDRRFLRLSTSLGRNMGFFFLLLIIILIVFGLDLKRFHVGIEMDLLLCFISDAGCFQLDRKSTRLNSSHVSLSYAF